MRRDGVRLALGLSSAARALPCSESANPRVDLHANICSMTSEGSPYARFHRALRIGRLSMVYAAAAELPRVDLDDALAITLLIERQDPGRYDRAVVRWLARLCLEVPTVGIEDLRGGLLAFEALPDNPAGARQALSDLCRRHGLTGAVGCPLRVP